MFLWIPNMYFFRIYHLCVFGCLVTKSCPTLWDPVDCSLPGSSVHGISQARILEWVALFFSRGSSLTRDRTCVSSVSCFAAGVFTNPENSSWVIFPHWLITELIVHTIRLFPIYMFFPEDSLKLFTLQWLIWIVCITEISASNKTQRVATSLADWHAFDWSVQDVLPERL